ncbi:hypothetical protein BP5796_07238 [Coleophoma crateriformis]|uniref:SprT-like domain-containing protein n=1 Tax=Coleophoma crateriformis TaxID=565419 RepID=A0A3D8RIL6_9HELO|nr:hypothetical protein BP5796_07238 [Coleophoma crateriformis]
MARLNTCAPTTKQSGGGDESGWDSSDTLPELDDVLFTTSTTTTQSRRVTCTKENLSSTSSSKDRRSRARCPSAGSASGKSEAEAPEAAVTKPAAVRKRRVLKPMTENPLLRPLSSTASSGRNPPSVSAATASERATVVPPRDGGRKVSTRGVAVPKLKASAARGLRESELAMGDLVRGLERTTLGSARRLPRSTASAAAKYILDEAEVDGGSADEEEDEDDDGMSDFIVNDSYIPTEGDSEVVDSPPPPPKSAKRLVKGRRPERVKSEVDDLGIDLGKLTMEPKEDVGWLRKEKEMLKQVVEIWDSSDEEVFTKKKPMKGKETEVKREVKMPEPSSGIDEPLATLSFSPSPRKPRVIPQGTRFTTPPPSPTKKALKSPTKKLASIPLTPHRPSMDGFWSQDVINDWNDEYSPRKEIKEKPLLEDEGSISEGELLFSPKKSPVKQDKLAREAKKAFSQTKHALAESFLKELDDAITDGQISHLAASTGGVKIIWSKKLNTTAGRANWRRETIRSPALGSDAPRITYRHHAAIELAEKVIDDADRLLNVLAHEFCHLANFMISNIKTNPHGKEFKAWASRVSNRFADRNIEVTTKHSYAIDYKYIWECSGCALEYKRHSKSIDPARHQCGSCRAKLVQIKPVPKKCSSASSADPAGRSAYQVFVKDHMKKVKDELPPGSPQKVVMGELGKRYREMKALKDGAACDGEESRDATPTLPEDSVAAVVRKLDFLDLTASP